MATTLKNSGAKWLSEEKVNFTPCINVLLGNKKSCIFSVGARDVYERAVEFFGEENADEKLFLSFAKFEENCKEVWIEALKEL